MFWNRYDKGIGDEPKIGDKVETCHWGSSSVDGEYKGVFAGWSTHDKISGILILDSPLPSGELAITSPIVCLRKQ